LTGASAPDTEPFKVRLQGTVIEAGTGLAVKGAEVRAAALEAKGGLILSSSLVSAAEPAFSDIDGNFELFVAGPGDYELRAQSEGYGSPGPEMDAYTPSIRALVKGGVRELRGLTIEIARPGTLAGRVLDEKTRAPLRGFSVFAAARSRRVMLDGEIGAATTTSDAEGGYQLTKLAPAPYRIRFEPPGEQRPAIAEGDVDLDETPPAEGYCTTWWPGVERRAQAGTQALESGQELDLGTIPALRCRSYTVAVRVTAPGCGDDDRMSVQLRPLDGRSGASAVLPCGASFHIKRLVVGDYELLFSTRAGGSGGRLRGMVAFTSIAKNMHLDATLTRGDRVCGVVKLPEPKRDGLDLSVLRVSISPPGGIRFPSDGAASVDGEGHFCKEGVGPWWNRIFLEALPTGMYVKQIRYNGAVIGMNWMPAPGALAHDLEITLAEGVARVEGTVMIGKSPVTDARVFLVRWPLEDANLRQQMRWMWTPSDGRFSFEGIAPGDYRLFASAREAAANWTPESVLAQLQVMKSMKVGNGETKNLTITTLAY